MRRLFWTAVLIAIALWMPRSAWIFVGLFGAALVFATGIWAMWRIGVGMVKAWRQ